MKKYLILAVIFAGALASATFFSSANLPGNDGPGKKGNQTSVQYYCPYFQEYSTQGSNTNNVYTMPQSPMYVNYGMMMNQMHQLMYNNYGTNDTTWQYHQNINNNVPMYNNHMMY